jgi:hypothetical protein
MEGISDIKVKGMDKARPPQILNYPCIFLFFELNHDVPKEWCEEFNRLFAKGKYPVRVNPDEGLFVETWVRLPDEIAKSLESIKQGIKTAITAYIARVNAKAGVKAETGTVVFVSEAQKQLNSVVAHLEFD